MFPVDQIRAYGVAPTHVVPDVSEWVVLVKEVVFAGVKHQAIRIIHPVLFRGEVVLWP